MRPAMVGAGSGSKIGAMAEGALLKVLCAAGMLIAGTAAAFAQEGRSVSKLSPDIVTSLAPAGKLRAAINFGNGVLAQRDPQTGAPRGVSADLAGALAQRLDVPVEFVAFEAAGKVFDALKTGAWDIAFLAIEPVRAAEIDFTPPYVLIEGTYMVPRESPLKTIQDVDRAGVRIAVGQGSAYDLYLTRTLKNATLVRATAGGGRAMIDLFLADKLEVAAGVRQPLVAYAKTDRSVRVMEGRFMVIQQAMGTPKGRDAGARYLRLFIEEMKASGFVADALARSNQPDAAVAPPAGN
ncbi:MAG: ABC transporter substrate-binding protein [Hyphomonadaceae bacterium]|nr:ABC transporter substrate-binding protein [Hyphomonadaceae bacterium]